MGISLGIRIASKLLHTLCSKPSRPHLLFKQTSRNVGCMDSKYCVYVYCCLLLQIRTKMTTLTIDIGNTSIKYAVFEGQTMVHYRRIIGHDIAPIADEIAVYQPAHASCVLQVR